MEHTAPRLAFFVAMVVALLAFATLATATNFASPINLDQHSLFVTQEFPTPSVNSEQKVEIEYTLTHIGPQGQTPLKLKFAKIQLYQDAVLLIDGDLAATQTFAETETKSHVELSLHPFSTTKIQDIPISLFLQHKLEKTPAELKLEVGSAIKVCLTVSQAAGIWIENSCVEHLVAPSALTPISITSDSTDEANLVDRIGSGSQTSFRAFCNGQAPPQPTFGQTALTPAIQTGCNSPNRFHINAYGLDIKSQSTSLVFHIGGHAQVHKKKEDVLNPELINCRVNTHFVNFIRSDKIEDQRARDFYPDGQVVYVANNVKELKSGGILEIECSDVGLFYPIHYTDPATKDRATVPELLYGTFIQVTIFDGAILTPDQEDKPITENFLAQPSFTMFFSEPALSNPVDFDINSTSNRLFPDDPARKYPLQFFGSFFLTGAPHKSDKIQICTLNINTSQPLSVLITQENFNSTSKTPVEGSPIPLFQDTVQKLAPEDPAAFIPETTCFGIDIFKQFPWRADSTLTVTPQVFRFVITTEVTDYQESSALYARYVSFGTGDREKESKEHVPLFVYAATPLPTHKTTFVDSFVTSPIRYKPEDAEHWSTYSAIFETFTLKNLQTYADRVAFVLAGNHYLDGDIQCYFQYTSVEGFEVEDYVSAHIDKTVQSARMVLFELESAIDITKLPDQSLELKCTGMFATSYSAANFAQKSTLHVFARDYQTKEFTLNVLHDFSVVDAQLAPQPPLPVAPTDNDEDEKNKKKNWVRVAIIISLVCIVVGVIFVVSRIVLARKNNGKHNGEPLLGEDSAADYIDIQ